MPKISFASVVRVCQVGAFALFAVLVVAAAFLYAVLQLVGVKFYTVESDSMAPHFGRGDVIAARARPAHEINAGDIVVFHQAGFGEPTVHRVVRIHSSPDVKSVVVDGAGKKLEESINYGLRTFWTKGDANPGEDTSPITGDQLLGRQLFVVPWPLNLIATRFDRETLFVLGAGLLVAYAAWEVIDAARAARRRQPVQAMSKGPELS